jgi:hypothetical protein
MRIDFAKDTMAGQSSAATDTLPGLRGSTISSPQIECDSWCFRLLQPRLTAETEFTLTQSPDNDHANEQSHRIPYPISWRNSSR